ncbi:MAG TPA: hypothetical protein VH815_10310 [Acidobacteriota bacterium]|jgi:hypothetical protein
MEDFKKYLPWIIGGIVLLYILKKVTSSSGTALIPQTQFTQTAQPDPYAQSRENVFTSLVQLAGLESQSDVQMRQAQTQEQANLLNAAVASQGIAGQVTQSANAANTALASSNAYLNALLQQANLNFLQRQNDLQAQNNAVNRYYSSRQSGDIVNSISQALSSIFSPTTSSGGVFGTPPIFGGFNSGSIGFGF